MTAKKADKGIEKEKRDDKDTPITKKELKHILQNKKVVSDFLWDLDLPFDAGIIARLYLPGYQLPKFRKFDGTGSAREYIMSFLDDLGGALGR